MQLNLHQRKYKIGLACSLRSRESITEHKRTLENRDDGIY